jgi:glutamate:GABA antiporter
MNTKIKKSLSVFTLAMINLAAVGSVKNWPLTAEYGFSSVFFYLFAALIFLIPVALVSAELATGWPEAGGIFVWVKEAFGQRTGFLAIWLLWIENVLWYPTALSFIAITIAYIFNPNYAENLPYLISMMLIIFWGATFLNLKGIRISSLISTVGVIGGTFIPSFIIIFLGIAWLISSKASYISFTWNAFFPNLGSLQQIVFFTGIILSLCGLEMSAIHAKDVKNPQRNYPNAIALSVLIILALSIPGVLSIAVAVPKGSISLVAGALQAFSVLLEGFGLKNFMPLMALMIAVGTIGSLATWILGPSRGLLVAAQNGDLPPFFRKVNRNNMPFNLMMVQASVVSLLSLIFLLVPSINAAYWILIALIAQMYLIMYVLMFAAAIRLRYKRPDIVRAYRIPFKNIGIWTVSIIGIASSLFCIIIGFFPPLEIHVANVSKYVIYMILATLFFCLIPSIILLFKKPSWNVRLKHEE